MQEYSSSKTCLNQIPALFRKWEFNEGSLNLDIGGGKFNLTTEFLENTYRVVNIVYAPFNRTEEENQNALSIPCEKFETVTCANTLNVIKELAERQKIYALAQKYVNAVCLFSVYEGDKSGIGCESKKDCWQNNRVYKDYIDEISEYFDYVHTVYGTIVAVGRNRE